MMGMSIAILLTAFALYFFRDVLKWMLILLLPLVVLAYISQISGVTDEYHRKNNNPIPPPLPGVAVLRGWMSPATTPRER